MPDLTNIIQLSAAHAWLYLPVAVVLGALHAMEPGHAKSLMAAYIISIRGTAGQAAVLGLSAAVGHTIVVWALAILGLLLGEEYIVEQAEPWLMLLSGVLVLLLGLRMIWRLRVDRGHGHSHSHDHHHAHHHDDQHAHPHYGPSRRSSTTGNIIWFGFTGGLLPCPSAIAVLLVCLHLKQFVLGVSMVAAFSVGLAATLVMIGIAASWGARKAHASYPALGKWADRLPFLSAGIVTLMGAVMAFVGASGIIAGRKSH
jgi:nickel/cobalt exporter